MGSALGGGAADQVLGAGSAQLTKLTVYGILGFFVLAIVLLWPIKIVLKLNHCRELGLR